MCSFFYIINKIVLLNQLRVGFKITLYTYLVNFASLLTFNVIYKENKIIGINNNYTGKNGRRKKNDFGRLSESFFLYTHKQINLRYLNEDIF